MKKIYILFSLALGFNLSSNAQLTLTKVANEPVIGDVNSTKDFDTVAVFPKSTGVGQSWNFSNMIPSGNPIEVNTYTSVAATPSPALFSNASLAMSKNGTEWNLYKSNTSTYDYAGMYFGQNSYAVFSNLGTAYSWPISYGSTNTDAFTASETSGPNTNTWSGSITYTALGTGTVTMPGGGVYNNCLMLKRVISLTMASATSTTQLYMVDYEFWSAGLKFPLITASYETATTGTLVSKDARFDLNASVIPLGVNENDKLSNQVNVFPNPANTELNIDLNNTIKNYSVVLTDLTGKKIIESVNTNKIDVSKIEKGIYILHVTGDNISARKTIAVTH
ncbi:MAG: T9SS type A sorting domain-containing protein [Bacteroidota bacterium]|nr:T9SS type A sorting domain-containing protein [Bacteroidota bacterium]MDP3145723.1 T9SS type A sorting domain-containing protein [Bacteroidota bacterium]MDP3558415.1 T9SS type A sorting domain-containing protein [Bacteroidota bacterium]